MVVQLTSDRKLRQRTRRAVSTGDIPEHDVQGGAHARDEELPPGAAAASSTTRFYTSFQKSFLRS